MSELRKKDEDGDLFAVLESTGDICGTVRNVDAVDEVNLF